MTLPSKYLVFVVSAGRTGTTFLGEVLSGIIHGAFSVHEPDVLGRIDKAWVERIRTFGLYHMVIGRLLGLTGIRNLSLDYLSGKIRRCDAIDHLHRQRDRYYGSISADYIVESYTQWFGLLPLLPDAFDNHKVVGLIRDPRTWAVSIMNHGTRFGHRDWITKLGLRHLDPTMIGDTDFVDRWPVMSSFEKICWHWQAISTLVHEHVRSSSDARLFRYEDLFRADNRVDHFTDMLNFITSFPSREFPYELSDEVLSTPVNASRQGGHSDWRSWDRQQALQLQRVCGPLMEQFGYGTEPEWNRLLS